MKVAEYPAGLKAGDLVGVWGRTDDGKVTPVASPVQVLAVTVDGSAATLQLNLTDTSAVRIWSAEGKGDLLVAALGPTALPTMPASSS